MKVTQETVGRKVVWQNETEEKRGGEGGREGGEDRGGWF